MLHLSQRQASSAQGALLFIMSSGFGFSVISSGVFRFGLDGWGFFGGEGWFACLGFVCVCLWGFCLGFCLFFTIQFSSSLVVWLSLLLSFLWKN